MTVSFSALWCHFALCPYICVELDQPQAYVLSAASTLLLCHGLAVPLSFLWQGRTIWSSRRGHCGFDHTHQRRSACPVSVSPSSSSSLPLRNRRDRRLPRRLVRVVSAQHSRPSSAPPRPEPVHTLAPPARPPYRSSSHQPGPSRPRPSLSPAIRMVSVSPMQMATPAPTASPERPPGQWQPAPGQRPVLPKPQPPLSRPPQSADPVQVLQQAADCCRSHAASSADAPAASTAPHCSSRRGNCSITCTPQRGTCYAG